MFNFFGKWIKSLLVRLDMALLEYLYGLHIRVRYLHDSAYKKGGWYKSYTDKHYTYKIHKTVFFGFLFSVVLYEVFKLLV